MTKVRFAGAPFILFFQVCGNGEVVVETEGFIFAEQWHRFQ